MISCYLQHNYLRNSESTPILILDCSQYPLFFREIVDVDRSVRPGRHLGLLMRAKLGREQNALGRGGGVNSVRSHGKIGDCEQFILISAESCNANCDTVMFYENTSGQVLCKEGV